MIERQAQVELKFLKAILIMLLILAALFGVKAAFAP